MKADIRFNGTSSYIMASYINAIEASGARTVPLIFNGDVEKEVERDPGPIPTGKFHERFILRYLGGSGGSGHAMRASWRFPVRC